MERDELNVEITVNPDMGYATLAVGDKRVKLTAEEALQIAEALAEAAGYLEGLTDADTTEPVDVDIHKAPEQLQ